VPSIPVSFRTAETRSRRSPESISTSPKSNSWDTHTAPNDTECLIFSGQNLLPDVACKDLYAENPRNCFDELSLEHCIHTLNPGLNNRSINRPPVVPVVEFAGFQHINRGPCSRWFPRSSRRLEHLLCRTFAITL
jgi:hypothetical protein